MARHYGLTALVLLAVGSTSVWAAPPPPGPSLPHYAGVTDLQDAFLSPSTWIQVTADRDRVILDSAAIEAQNARMRAEDKSLHDLRALPAQLPRADVVRELKALSTWPDKQLYGVDGQLITAAQRTAIEANLAAGAIADHRELRYGLVTHRAALRTFPTMLRVFSRQGDTDIDRFQESALFPGDAVAVLHESADGEWLFVTSERYTAWIESRFVGIGATDKVLNFGSMKPFLVVTGATEYTVFTPEEPRVSRLQLDMGVRLPVIDTWPAQQPVNGQHKHAGIVVGMPVREADGSLAFKPALIPRSADVSADYLELTPRNLYLQAFKFLGERYGWGHSYDTRDCSGFVSEVYRSFGILMPRNTSAQAVSPALDRIAFSAKDSKAKRMEAVKNLQPGDLVYIPGHVMMTLGHLNGHTWMIHDTAGGSWFGPDGRWVDAHLNGVSVTPLELMMASETVSYIDRITNIQRMRTKTP
ncbi:SH3 domain-containing protein [Stenotrophomonas sp. PS02289]|uniref:C40 family peptidase n=1 Tax=Stenotrophomonas sp. PS02289 TaxID=2991422 RepID=UPI002499C5F6|nr:SH3 domain-containing protein [Stenotrophomonas sp. PS02289]